MQVELARTLLVSEGLKTCVEVRNNYILAGLVEWRVQTCGGARADGGMG